MPCLRLMALLTLSLFLTGLDVSQISANSHELPIVGFSVKAALAFDHDHENLRVWGLRREQFLMHQDRARRDFAYSLVAIVPRPSSFT